MNIRFYGPVSEGTFAGMIDDFGRAGATCTSQSPTYARCTWRGARFNIAIDFEMTRAQLVDDAGLGAHAWDVIDPILSRANAERTGWEPSWRSGDAPRDLGSDICDLQPCPYTDVDGNPTMYASGRPAGHVGGDGSIDMTGEYLNADGSSSWPGASGLLDDGWIGPSLPNGQKADAMKRSYGKPYAEVMADHANKTEELRARRDAAKGGGAHRVGAFFYDADFAKFGNAFNPFVQAGSFERANLALQRPFQDRHNPRYDSQPTWAEWQRMGEDILDAIDDGQGMGGYDPSRGQDPNLPGGPCGCFPTRECLERHGLCMDCGGGEFVGAIGPQIVGDHIVKPPSLQKTTSSHAVHMVGAGEMEIVDKRALVATAAIAGITTLFALRNRDHWLEIAAAGAAGVALTWGLSVARSGRLAASR